MRPREPPPQPVGVDEERERLHAVDRDDGNPLAEAALELLVARDVDLLEVERRLAADVVEDAAGALAKVAARRGVEGDARGYGYSPRVVVASATRPTASA